MKLAYETDELKEKLKILKEENIKKEKEIMKKLEEIQEELEDIEYEKKYTREKIEKKKKEMEELRKKLPEEILEFYDKYRESLGGKVVAVVENGACSVCTMKIPGKVYSEIIKGKEGKCPNCGRWIFYIE